MYFEYNIIHKHLSAHDDLANVIRPTYLANRFLKAWVQYLPRYDQYK